MQRSDPRHLPSGVELLAATTTRPFPLGVPGGGRSLPLPPLVCVIAEIAGGCACILCFPIAPQRARAPRGRVPARAGSIFYTQAGRENQLSQGAPGQPGTTAGVRTSVLAVPHLLCTAPPLNLSLVGRQKDFGVLKSDCCLLELLNCKN